MTARGMSVEMMGATWVVDDDEPSLCVDGDGPIVERRVLHLRHVSGKIDVDMMADALWLDGQRFHVERVDGEKLDGAMRARVDVLAERKAPDTGADFIGWWRDAEGVAFEVVACDRLGYVESSVPGRPLANIAWPVAQAREHVAAGRWTRVEAPRLETDEELRERIRLLVSLDGPGMVARLDVAYGIHLDAIANAYGLPRLRVATASGADLESLAALHGVHRDPREYNRTVARAAEASPPDVRGLLLFGQRKGPAWERSRHALAAEVERCNCRPEPEMLTSARIEAIARESVRED